MPRDEAFAATDDSSVLTIDRAPRETDSFPMHRSRQRLAFITERDLALDQNRPENAPHAQQIDSKVCRSRNHENQ
jgi:hypothetical protein